MWFIFVIGKYCSVIFRPIAMQKYNETAKTVFHNKYQTIRELPNAYLLSYFFFFYCIFHLVYWFVRKQMLEIVARRFSHLRLRCLTIHQLIHKSIYYKAFLQYAAKNVIRATSQSVKTYRF